MIRWTILACLLGCEVPTGEYYGVIPEPDTTRLRFCNSGEPEYIDPALVTSTTGIIFTRAMFSGLAEYTAEGYPELDMATKLDKHPSLSRYAFTLKQDLKWSDGVPLNAHDFVYHMQRILHGDTLSRLSGQAWDEQIKNAEEFSSGTVRKLLVDVDGIPKGTYVDVLGAVKDGKIITTKDKKGEKDITDFTKVPDANQRTVLSELSLRTFARENSSIHGKVAKDATVSLIEYDKSGNFAYVFKAAGGGNEGQYGWVKASGIGPMDSEKAATMIKIRTLPKNRIVGLTLSGEDLKLAMEGKESYLVDNPKPDPAAGKQGTAEELAVIRDGWTAKIRAIRDYKLVEATVRSDQTYIDPAAVGIYAKNDYELVVELAKPKPSFVNGIAARFFRPSPRHVVAPSPLHWINPRQVGKDKIVVSGPFKIVDWIPNDKMEFEKNQTYHGAKDVSLQRLTSYSIDDQAASARMYYTGECDAVASNNIPASYLTHMRGIEGPQKKHGQFKDFYTSPYYGIYYYMINNEDEIMSNKHYRRALSLSINRSPIPYVLGGGQIPTASWNPGKAISSLTPEERQLCGVKEGQKGTAMIVRAGELCYVPPLGWEFDAKKAKEELAIAKKELGSKFTTTVSLKYNKGSEGHTILAEYIQAQWKENLGLQAELSSQEWKTYLSETSEGRYQIGRMGWIGSSADPESMVQVFKCGNPQNRARYCGEEFEKYMKLAEETTDEKKRLEFVKQAETAAISDMPVIPIYVYTQQHLRKPYVKGLPMNFFDNISFHRVTIDPNWRSAK